jgi:uncharacterized protein (TIGR03437 family)
MRTIAGGTDAGDGARAAESSIRFLQGVATDALGNVYISDADDHRVRRIDRSGVITTLAGDGLPGFSGDGGPGSRARVNTPYGLTVTPLGDLIFADLGNARVRRIARNGQIETIVGGGTRETPAAGQFIPPKEIRLLAPRNVLASSSGSLFISDFGSNRILELRSDGSLTSLPLTGVELNSPAGLTLDADGNLLVADSGNARIRRIRRDGRVDIVAAASKEMPLERPVGLARRPDGSLLIADTRGDFLWQLDSQGKSSILPPGGRDVAVDPFGSIVTAGSTWLRRVNTQGLIEILIGNNFATYRGDGGPALAARLNRPLGVAADSKGNLYFTDTGNHRVRCIRPDGSISTVAGAGEAGFRGDGALATQAYLNAPTYLAVDAFDNIYVSDTGNHRVRVFTSGGSIQTVAGTGRNEFSSDGGLPIQTSIASPQGLALDREGNLYIAERGQNRVRRFAPGGRIATVAGSSIRGDSGDGQDALAARLNSPTAIAVDGQGTLYIADTGNQSIRAVDAASGRIRTLVRDLLNPEGLTVSANGTLYFSEAQRHRIQQITLSGDVSLVAGRTGENGFNADSGDATALTLNEPTGVAIMPDGSLVVADRLNDRIRRIDPPAEIIVSNLQSTRVVHAATFAEGPVAPGQLLSLLTGDLSRPDLAEVIVDAMSAPVHFAGKTQVNFQMPYAIAGRTRVTLELRVGGALIHRQALDVAGATPAFFESSGLIVAVRPDGALNSDATPARSGDLLTLYGTGEGLLREAAGLQVPFLPTSVDIGGIPAELLYAGAAPGFSGLLQVNLRVPEGIRLRGRVPVTLKVGAFQNPKSQVIVVQ